MMILLLSFIISNNVITLCRYHLTHTFEKSSGFLQSLIGFIQLTSQMNSLQFLHIMHIMTKNCGNVHPLIQMVDYELLVIILICRVGYSIPLYSGFCVLFVSTLGNNYILEFYLVHVLAHVSNP